MNTKEHLPDQFKAYIPPAGVKELPVQIAEGTDLNHLQEPDKSRFSPEIFNDLPELINDACRIIEDPTDREVFLFSTLGIISGMLPNICGEYGGKQYEPNLYCFLIAPFGAGKGFLSQAKLLGDQIHDEMRASFRVKWESYEALLNTDKKGQKEVLAKPKKSALFLPANTSKSGLIELLDDNEGRGILFETEGDTLVEALRQDHGGFSDVLRKAFHHESISINRRALDEFRELNLPRLSVVLSGTFDQYVKLIPNINNGLFSRFIHYQIRHTPDFKDVFNPAQKKLKPHFLKLGAVFHRQFNYLQTRKDNPVIFRLCEEHQNMFLQQFDTWKKELSEYASIDMAGVVNRLGVICFRIAMILTAVRRMERGNLSSELIADTIDFNNALRLTLVFQRNALQLFDILPQNQENRLLRQWENELEEKADKIAMARQLHQSGMSYAEIGYEIFGEHNHKSTIWRWINK
jgi:hypothetical protein